MAKKEYMFYPGCTAESLASGSNYLTSVESMCEVLDIQLNEIPDWNCCGASVGYVGGSELPRLALNARNLAIAEQVHPEQDVVATCAACWLGARETRDRLEEDNGLMRETNEALAEAGLKYEAKQKVRHMVEVLIEDFGYEELERHVKKPLDGVKIAGYVGCQTNRPFGIEGKSFENPKYLDKLSDECGDLSIPDQSEIQDEVQDAGCLLQYLNGGCLWQKREASGTRHSNHSCKAARRNCRTQVTASCSTPFAGGLCDAKRPLSVWWKSEQALSRVVVGRQSRFLPKL